MKKITLALSSLLVFQLANAQVFKGSIFTGGSVNVQTSTNDNSNIPNSKSINTSWSVLPQIGVAVRENKVIGFQLSVAGATNKNYNAATYESKNTSNNFGAGVFYRQYIPIAAKWMFFGQAAINVSFSSNKGFSNDIKTNKGNGWQTGLGITPGIAFKVNKKTWLEASIGNMLALNYNHQKNDNLNTDGTVLFTQKQNSFSANANINPVDNFNIGIRWIIPKS
jgi:hypothetical protein